MLDLNKLSSKELKLAVSETLKVIDMFQSPENSSRIRSEMESMPDEEALKNYLCEEMTIYMKPFNEIPKDVIDNIIKSERIILTEYISLPHVMHDENGNGIVSRKKHLLLPLPVRSNQQRSFKEGASAANDDQRNVANQFTGDAKKGTLSDTEIVTLTSHGGDEILKELLGVTSHDTVAYNEMRQKIIQTGEVSLKDLTNESKNKGSLLMMDQIMKHLGFDTNIIENPEK